jgi:IS5 family transposase
MFACPATNDFFRARIDHMIDLCHPLAVLSSRMPWQQIEASVSHLFSRKGRAGVAMHDLDLFGQPPKSAQTTRHFPVFLASYNASSASLSKSLAF